MAGRLASMINIGDRVVRPNIPKWAADSNAVRAGRVAAKAIRCGASHFAIRYAHYWHIYPVSGPTPIKSFADEAAAEMWLLHRGRK